jgi:hypothetical protein
VVRGYRTEQTGYTINTEFRCILRYINLFFHTRASSISSVELLHELRLFISVSNAHHVWYSALSQATRDIRFTSRP